tara:strand:- start:569 stop:1093 length:525 start_codon:yes stop_codon:yes gene_type:complete
MNYPLILLSAFMLQTLVSEDLNTTECNTKMTQIMKPMYPRTNYQGFGTVQFNIDKTGSVTDVKAVQSLCAVGRDENGKIELKECPFFKSNSVGAAKYIKYKPPLDQNGEPCEVSGKVHRYKFTKYRVKDLDYDDFLLRDDFKNRDKKYKDITVDSGGPILEDPNSYMDIPAINN